MRGEGCGAASKTITPHCPRPASRAPRPNDYPFLAYVPTNSPRASSWPRIASIT